MLQHTIAHPNTPCRTGVSNPHHRRPALAPANLLFHKLQEVLLWTTTLFCCFWFHIIMFKYRFSISMMKTHTKNKSICNRPSMTISLKLSLFRLGVRCCVRCEGQRQIHWNNKRRYCCFNRFSRYQFLHQYNNSVTQFEIDWLFFLVMNLPRDY